MCAGVPIVVVFMHNASRSQHNMVTVTAQGMTDRASWNSFVECSRVHGFVDLVFTEHKWPADDHQNVTAINQLAEVLKSKAIKK